MLEERESMSILACSILFCTSSCRQARPLRLLQVVFWQSKPKRRVRVL